MIKASGRVDGWILSPVTAGFGRRWVGSCRQGLSLVHVGTEDVGKVAFLRNRGGRIDGFGLSAVGVELNGVRQCRREQLWLRACWRRWGFSLW